MNHIIRIIFVTVLITFPLHNLNAVESQKRYEISSLRMTVSDFDDILNNTRSLIKNANKSTPTENTRETISLSHNGNTLKLDKWDTLNSKTLTLNYITGVEYEYYSTSQSPITRVNISLRSYNREITVTGTDNTQVDAISSVLTTKLDEHSNFFSSDLFKLLGMSALIIIGMVILNIRKNGKEHILAISIGCSFLLAPTVLPWSNWLPGVAIFSDTSSFIDRHINVISVIGVALAVISIFMTLLLHNKKQI